MGSSISGILAISYMDRLERRALNICPPDTFFTRYIDDILIVTSSEEEAKIIIEKFQNTDSHIQFKAEHPDNTGSLALLDFRLNKSTIKESKMIEHWSFGSFSSRKNPH